MRDLERIRYVAANYGRLQGLRKVPLGLVILSLVALLLVALAWPVEEDLIVPVGYAVLVLAAILAVFLGAFLLYFRISGYYERRYGLVRQRFSRVPLRRKALYWMMFVAVALGGSLALLLLGAAMLAAYWPERRFRAHYVVMAALIVGIGLAHMVCVVVYLTNGAWLWPVGEFAGLARNYAWTALGLYFLVGGVLDHQLLVRSMKDLPEEER